MSDPDNPKYVRLFRLRTLGAEATSLEEFTELIEGAAKELRSMLRSGKVWLVADTAENDRAELGTDSANLAERFGFEDASKVRSGDIDDPEDFPDDLDELVAS